MERFIADGTYDGSPTRDLISQINGTSRAAGTPFGGYSNDLVAQIDLARRRSGQVPIFRRDFDENGFDVVTTPCDVGLHFQSVSRGQVCASREILNQYLRRHFL